MRSYKEKAWVVDIPEVTDDDVKAALGAATYNFRLPFPMISSDEMLRRIRLACEEMNRRTFERME